MKNESHEPELHLDTGPILLESLSEAVAVDLDDSFSETRRLRKDGWDAANMATFIGTLAETGVVTFACRACGMSAQSAYVLRRRDFLFATAWEAALSMARERLADELLARSLKGSADQLLHDGAIVAERHHFDNKLAFAMLRRLDRRAELGATFRTPPAAEVRGPPPAIAGEWQNLVDAMADGRTADVERLLAPTPSKVDSEVYDPPIEGFEDSESEDAVTFEHARVWRDWPSDGWRTDFPPPAAFDGDENGDWEDDGYARTLTADELAGLIAAGIAEPDEAAFELSIEDDEAARAKFFSELQPRQTH
jgi:hypothetical protein